MNDSTNDPVIDEEKVIELTPSDFQTAKKCFNYEIIGGNVDGSPLFVSFLAATSTTAREALQHFFPGKFFNVVSKSTFVAICET